jgi:uncharacterized membrane protein HdeD (DUF308 family)
MPKTLEETSLTPDLMHALYENRWLYWVSGAISIILGVLALLMPYVATLAAELVIGGILLVSGIFEGVTAFRLRSAGQVAVRVILALIGIIAGALLLITPLSGMIALAMVLAAFFIASGLVKLYLAWKLNPDGGWGWMAFSGMLTLALGLLIATGLPGTAFWVLGLLLGIDLIFYGVAAIAAVMAAQRAVRGTNEASVEGSGMSHAAGNS